MCFGYKMRSASAAIPPNSLASTWQFSSTWTRSQMDDTCSAVILFSSTSENALFRSLVGDEDEDDNDDDDDNDDEIEKNLLP